MSSDIYRQKQSRNSRVWTPCAASICSIAAFVLVFVGPGSASEHETFTNEDLAAFTVEPMMDQQTAALRERELQAWEDEREKARAKEMKVAEKKTAEGRRADAQSKKRIQTASGAQPEGVAVYVPAVKMKTAGKKKTAAGKKKTVRRASPSGTM